MSNLALNRRVGSDGFRAAVARWCTEGAEIARGLENLSTAQSLDDLAEYLSSLDLEDQVHRTLYSISGAAGWDTEVEWKPGSSAADFRANVGYQNRPTPSEALAELTAVCTDDFIVYEGERRSALNQERQDAAAKASRLEEADLRTTAVTAENDRLAAELSETREKLSLAEEKIDHLQRRHVPAAASKKTNATKNGNR